MIFKNADKKFKKLGYTKVEENDFYCIYEKFEEAGKYIHRIDLGHKASGNHLIHSYEKDTYENGFCRMVGLTQKEAYFCLEKMLEKGWLPGKK